MKAKSVFQVARRRSSGKTTMARPTLIGSSMYASLVSKRCATSPDAGDGG